MGSPFKKSARTAGGRGGGGSAERACDQIRRGGGEKKPFETPKHKKKRSEFPVSVGRTGQRAENLKREKDRIETD